MTITFKINRDQEFYERIEEHAARLRALSPEEQMHVRERMGWVEQGNLLEAEITIHDRLGRDKDFPRATIRHHDGRWETIDIIKSIENNALSIGHPAILFAIHRWEQIVRCQRVLSNPTRRKVSKVPSNDVLKYPYEISKNHLKRIGKALLDGAESRAWSKYDVFEAQTRSSSTGYDLLRLAWEALANQKIKKIRNSEEQLRKLKQKILKVYREHGFHGSTRLEPPSDFVLRSVAEWTDPIISFIRDNRLHRKRRSTWIAMRNKYDAWRFGLDTKTIRTYHSLALKVRRMSKENERDNGSPKLQRNENPAFFASHNESQSFFISELGSWLSLPVIHATEDYINPNADDYYADRHSPEYIAEAKSYDEYWRLLFEAECSADNREQ